MTKSRSKRFEMLRKLADHNEKGAAERLGQSAKLLNEHSMKLDELIAFREEYINHYQATGRNGISASELQTFQAFLQQLDTAIEQQKFVTESARVGVDKSKQDWQEKHTKTRIYETTLDRFQREDDKKQSKAEQAAHDELSGVATSGKNSSD